MMNEITERPGENPENVPPTTDVWLDISKLKTGQNGAIAYNIAATYAHNNGMIFIGDPAGLSDAALRRRTEQMISSALKFGTTDHLAPHPRQVQGDSALGVPPLTWAYGDNEANIERMIDASKKSLENTFPTSRLVAYKDGYFYRTDTGKLFLDARQLARVVGQSIKNRFGVAGGIEQTGYGGWRSVARNALFSFLKSSSTASGRADGRELLDRLRDELQGLRAGQTESGTGETQSRIFYSQSPFDGIEKARTPLGDTKTVTVSGDTEINSAAMDKTTQSLRQLQARKPTMIQPKTPQKSTVLAPSLPKRLTLASQQVVPHTERFRCLKGAIAEQLLLHSGKPSLDTDLPPF